jgi:O-acetylhomoserine/O-acetylserine sulfhydrylase-like pyridoxal-dependent enzyme
MTVLQMLKSGDHVVAHDDLYGGLCPIIIIVLLSVHEIIFSGTGRMFRRIASNQGLTFSFVNAQDAKNVEDAIKPNTKVGIFMDNVLPNLIYVNAACLD